MKIGILTQPLKNNYGGLLQAYALQVVLKRMGHEVLTIDTKAKGLSSFNKLKIIVKRLFLRYVLNHKNIVSIVPFEFSVKEKNVISKNTTQFITNYITTTEKINSSIRLSHLNKYQFNALIVGSDQVWRPRYSPCIGNYFLDFLGNDKSIKRISYAASFGVDDWEFTPKQTKRFAPLLQLFNNVSVREDSGIKLCKEKMGVAAIQVLDPTFLLSKDDYLKLTEKENIPQTKKSLMTYVLDKSEFKMEVINTIAKELNLTPNVILPNNVSRREKNMDISKYIIPTPLVWLRGFYDADYVVTDSFHGTVFSIIFNKPFIVVGNEKRGMSRFLSLLKKYDLESRIVNKSSDLTINKIKASIDWNAVNKIKEQKQMQSINFLKEALGN